jgi:recombination protein RecR
VLEIKALRDLTEELGKLPGIGRKSAQRIAFYLLKQPKTRAEKLAGAIVQLKEKIMPCRECFNISEDGLCAICKDPQREKLLCVVEDIGDLLAIERTGEFHGIYHVLTGVISPLDGIGPENLKIRELLHRVEELRIEQVILATNLTVEGEATAMYISRLLKPKGAKVYRIAHGLPVGGSLEHTDEATMVKAFEGRKEM